MPILLLLPVLCIFDKNSTRQALIRNLVQANILIVHVCGRDTFFSKNWGKRHFCRITGIKRFWPLVMSGLGFKSRADYLPARSVTCIQWIQFISDATPGDLLTVSTVAKPFDPFTWTSKKRWGSNSGSSVGNSVHSNHLIHSSGRTISSQVVNYPSVCTMFIKQIIKRVPHLVPISGIGNNTYTIWCQWKACFPSLISWGNLLKGSIPALRNRKVVRMDGQDIN